MKISIIGCGNIGTALAVYFTKNGFEVSIYSTKLNIHNATIEAIDSVNDNSFSVNNIQITNDLKHSVNNADIICITYPSFMIEEIFKKLSTILDKCTMIGVIPGTGGMEFFSNLLKNHTLFGLDRTPCISRIKEYGKSVYHSLKKSVRIAAIKTEKTQDICKIFSQALGIPCLPLKNYLTLTLTPSNPILHTARNYSIFINYNNGFLYDRNILFYKEWTDSASEYLINMDNELQQTCKVFKSIDLSDVIPITVYYESTTIQQMTDKLCGITSLSKINSPMKETQGGYLPDFSSRYFTEDIPFGLTILKGFAQIAQIKTPYMDEVLKWHGKMLDEEYIDNNGYINQNSNCVIPQKFNINSLEDTYDFYNRL